MGQSPCDLVSDLTLGPVGMEATEVMGQHPLCGFVHAECDPQAFGPGLGFQNPSHFNVHDLDVSWVDFLSTPHGLIIASSDARSQLERLSFYRNRSRSSIRPVRIFFRLQATEETVEEGPGFAPVPFDGALGDLHDLGGFLDRQAGEEA